MKSGYFVGLVCGILAAPAGTPFAQDARWRKKQLGLAHLEVGSSLNNFEMAAAKLDQYDRILVFACFGVTGLANHQEKSRRLLTQKFVRYQIFQRSSVLGEVMPAL